MNTGLAFFISTARKVPACCSKYAWNVPSSMASCKDCDFWMYNRLGLIVAYSSINDSLICTMISAAPVSGENVTLVVVTVCVGTSADNAVAIAIAVKQLSILF